MQTVIEKIYFCIPNTFFSTNCISPKMFQEELGPNSNSSHIRLSATSPKIFHFVCCNKIKDPSLISIWYFIHCSNNLIPANISFLNYKLRLPTNSRAQPGEVITQKEEHKNSLKIMSYNNYQNQKPVVVSYKAVKTIQHGLVRDNLVTVSKCNCHVNIFVLTYRYGRRISHIRNAISSSVSL